MGDRNKGTQIDWIISTGDPNNVSNSVNRKRVRSVAAVKSWPERRRKLFEQLRPSGKGRGAFLVEVSGLERKALDDEATGVKQGTEPHPPILSTATNKTITTADSRNSPCSMSSLAESQGPLSCGPAPIAAVAHEQAVLIGNPCRCYECQRKRKLSNTPPNDTEFTHSVIPSRSKRMADGTAKIAQLSGDMALITPPSSPKAPSQGRADPFNCYPVPYQPWFDYVLHHMMTIYAPRGWPALKITNEQGVKWEWFMTQCALSEPALFYVRLLFGSGDMIRQGTLKSKTQFWLRAQAIKAINAALADTNRACSDALTLAIGRIAMHEHVHGDKHASRVHRLAQKRMIEIRGGLKAIEAPELVKRLMRWGDYVMAIGSGTERMLEDDAANPNFTLKESVGAIARYTPHKMSSFRSKIQISDLVNGDKDG